LRNFTVNLGKATWQVPPWAQFPVLVLSIPAVVVLVLALIVALPAILLGAAVGTRVA